MRESLRKTDLLDSGAVIAGKYRIEGVLGEGGMGVVYEARHLRIGQRVAIKMLRGSLLRTPELVLRFEREARAAGQLRSPHTVRVIDVDTTPEGLPYMVMELLEGKDLAVELAERGTMSVREAVDCALQTASAMTEAHACGVVHRDLKPSNLFLACEGTAVMVKVLDFGISKLTEHDGEAHLTSTLATMGTPLYMSPEQVRSAKNVDARSDVWSLGVILFELLAGRPPFNGTAMAVSAAIVADPPPRLRDLRPAVPEELEHVVIKALAKPPEARWQDMQAFARALAPFGSAAHASLTPPVLTPMGRPHHATPSFVSAPTLAAPTPRSSPMAHTEDASASVGSASTEASWATLQPARKARARVGLLAGLIGVPVAAAAAFGIFLVASRTHGASFDGASTRGEPAASAVVALPPSLAATAAPVESTAAPPAPSASAALTATAPSTAPRATPRPSLPVAPTRPVAAPAQPPSSPIATANPNRL